MVESFMTTNDVSGYNKLYKHQWVTSTNALPLTISEKLSKMCSKRWGWHFIPHENMDYSRENWFQDQTLILTFESKWDLIHAKLRVSL